MGGSGYSEKIDKRCDCCEHSEKKVISSYYWLVGRFNKRDKWVCRKNAPGENGFPEVMVSDVCGEFRIKEAV